MEPARHKGTKNSYAPLSPDEEQIGKAVVDAAYTVHKALGAGLLEHVYEVCFCHELSKRDLRVRRQVPMPIVYDGLKFDEGFRIDVLVGELVVCELKAVTELKPIFTAQLLSYLKLTRKRLGYLINFNVPVIKQGIKRLIV